MGRRTRQASAAAKARKLQVVQQQVASGDYPDDIRFVSEALDDYLRDRAEVRGDEYSHTPVCYVPGLLLGYKCFDGVILCSDCNKFVEDIEEPWLGYFANWCAERDQWVQDATNGGEGQLS